MSEKSEQQEIDYSKVHTLVTHAAPDFDALVSTYLMKQALPRAEIKFVHMGSKIEHEDHKGILLHIDTGGIHHDHHHLWGYCVKCFQETGNLFLVPQDSFLKLKCPNCGTYVKDGERGHFDRTISSTFIVAKNKKILSMIPGDIKYSAVFKPLIDAVNRWDCGKFDTVGENGKDLLAFEAQGYAHVFKLLEGFNLLHPEDTVRDSIARMKYATRILDRLFVEERKDLVVKMDRDPFLTKSDDRLAVEEYDLSFNKSLFNVKDGAIFNMEHGVGILYDHYNHNEKVIYRFFNLFAYNSNHAGWAGCSVKPGCGLNLDWFYEALRKIIVKKKLFGNYPGKEGEDGELILVANDEIVIFDPKSISNAESYDKHAKRISVNKKRFKSEIIDSHIFLRLVYDSFSKYHGPYEAIWQEFRENSKLRHKLR